MSDNKKYYYMKLKEDFFISPGIRLLESKPDGVRYSNLLLKMYLSSLRFDGMLCLSPNNPYTPEMLSKLTGFRESFIYRALDVFENMGLITRLPSGIIYMDEIQSYVGTSSSEGDRKREYRRRILTQSGKEGCIPDTTGQKSGQMSGLKPIF